MPLLTSKAAHHRQRGIGLGTVILMIILLVAISSTVSKFTGNTPNGAKQRANLDAAALMQQAAQLRNGITLLGSAGELAWTHAGMVPSTGKLALVNTTASYTDTTAFPTGPVGFDNANIVWQIGSTGLVSGNFSNPTLYAWTSPTVSLAVCTQMGLSLTGVATPAEAAIGLKDSTAAVGLSGSPANARTLTAAIATKIDTALGAQVVRCLRDSADAADAYRVLVRLNN